MGFQHCGIFSYVCNSGTWSFACPMWLALTVALVFHGPDLFAYQFIDASLVSARHGGVCLGGGSDAARFCIICLAWASKAFSFGGGMAATLGSLGQTAQNFSIWVACGSKLWMVGVGTGSSSTSSIGDEGSGLSFIILAEVPEGFSVVETSLVLNLHPLVFTYPGCGSIQASFLPWLHPW